MNSVLSPSIVASIEKLMKDRLEQPWHARGTRAEVTGRFQSTAILASDKCDVFVKVASDSTAWNRFEAEYEGLSRLSAMGCPTPVLYGIARTADGTEAALVMEAIIASSPDWEHAARAVAKLHQNLCGQFGLERDNWIGRLPQQNGMCENWADFYGGRRLEPMLRIAVDTNRVTQDDAQRLRRLIHRLPTLCCPEPIPSLLHGDLYRGNIMFGPTGSILIDPAMYYGHREMDLSMARLGDELFPNRSCYTPRFFDAYGPFQKFCTTSLAISG